MAGFQGCYEVVVTQGGKTVKRSAELAPGGTALTFKLADAPAE